MHITTKRRQFKTLRGSDAYMTREAGEWDGRQGSWVYRNSGIRSRRVTREWNPETRLYTVTVKTDWFPRGMV